MRSFENLVGQTLQNAEGKTLESADKIRTAITEVVEFGDQALRRCDRGDAAHRRLDQERARPTRAELKKGVIEMPEEAKESTTAIRRAVSEQINALKELSDIVAKSGRSGRRSRSRATCARRRKRLSRALPSRRAARRRRSRSVARLRHRWPEPPCAARSTSNVRPRRRRAPRDRQRPYAAGRLGARSPDRGIARGGRQARSRTAAEAPRSAPPSARRFTSWNR